MRENRERCVIVGGADIGDYDKIKEYLTETDFFIFCDSGLKHLDRLGVKADLIVGDFDSHKKPDTEIKMIVLPCEKDDTDTAYAVKEGVKMGFNSFFLIGVVGNRIDHSLANISNLLYLDSLGLKGCIIDDYSEMSVVSGTEYVEDKYPFFSLLNISGTAKKITIENAKYPLDGGEIDCNYQYAVSNEIIKGRVAKVSVGEGRVLLVKVFKA